MNSTSPKLTSGSSAAVYADRVYENQGLLELVEMVDPAQSRILDIGCGTGSNLALLIERGHRATGLTVSKAEAQACKAKGLEVVVADITAQRLPFGDRSFGALFVSHVLEHIAYPADFLRGCKRVLGQEGSIYAAIPNVLHYKTRWAFMRGRFRYEEAGVLDRTHLRFFDYVSAAELFEEAGFLVIERHVSGAVPSWGMRAKAPGVFGSLDRLALSALPGLFGYHLLFKAVPK